MPEPVEAATAKVSELKPVTIRPIKLDFKEPALKEQKKKKFWMGALPGPETLGLWFAKPAAQSDGTLLYAPEQVVARWVGKCKYLQNFDVNGGHFPAYSEPPQQNANNEIVRLPLPGAISWYLDEQLERVKKGVSRAYVRVEDTLVEDVSGEQVEVERKIARLINFQDPDYIDDSGKSVAGPMHPLLRYNPRTDTPLGRYVYMVEVEPGFERPSFKEFLKNPPPAMIPEP